MGRTLEEWHIWTVSLEPATGTQNGSLLRVSQIRSCLFRDPINHDIDDKVAAAVVLPRNL